MMMAKFNNKWRASAVGSIENNFGVEIMEPFQPISGFSLLLGLLNAVIGLVVIYSLFSVPVQIVRRIRRTRQNQPVSPMGLILRKLLKGWFISALILIPTAVALIVIAGNKSAQSGADIYFAAITQGVLGNILTSLFVGYALMKATKSIWSVSERTPEKT